MNPLTELRRRLGAMPKVDLHRHLEGSLRLRTLSDIALEHGIDLPSYDIEYLRRFATVTDDIYDFQRFLEKFSFLRGFYTSQEAVERIAYEAVADAAADNVKYLELRFNPVALARRQQFSYHDVAGWVCAAVGRAACDTNVTANLIIQIGREEPVEVGHGLVDVALAFREHGVVGVDLAGDEIRHPAAAFTEVFRRARDGGLHVTIHAGEAGDASNVREAIELLGAERIGHGIRAIDSPEVMALARERRIAFEVCPTSNIQTGLVDQIGRHPLVTMLAQGARVTINTDDPSICDMTLTDEYMMVMLAMSVTLQQIKRAILTAVDVSFQAQGDRERMAAWFQRELASF